uniref:Uncharacterized protein n=1 Tax=Solanum lycopersicum TaxID=4081 RepID=A0A3Q7GBE3_SOLLC
MVLQLTGKSKCKSTPQFKKFSSPINPPKAEAQSSDAKLRLSLNTLNPAYVDSLQVSAFDESLSKAKK